VRAPAAWRPEQCDAAAGFRAARIFVATDANRQERELPKES
jgi:hypothetical protein